MTMKQMFTTVVVPRSCIDTARKMQIEAMVEASVGSCVDVDRQPAVGPGRVRCLNRLKVRVKEINQEKAAEKQNKS